MDAVRAKEILQRQIGQIDALKRIDSSDLKFTKWQRDTEVAIQKIFGDDSRNFHDFSDNSYSLIAFATSTSDYEFHQAYVRGLVRAEAILTSMVDEINDYDLDGIDSDKPSDSLKILENTCLRFHNAARQLQSRHADRETLRINDEYDFQDLLHALLRLHFDDIRPEEWTPSYAGGSSRVDFLLKEEQVVIEVKKTRSSLRTTDIGAELLVDIARYERHPDCGLLVCFIYDPEGRIGNPVGLERDLEDHSGALNVRVIVGPKGH